MDGKIVLCGSRTVILDTLQKRVVELVHEGHQGLLKSRSLLGSKDWFPRMDIVDFVVEKCFPCQVAIPSPIREPLNTTSLPSGLASVDFCEVAEHYILVVVDDYSEIFEDRDCSLYYC